MGEYMTVVNLDKKEYFSIAPLKFWEQIANQMVPIAIYWLVTHRHDNIGFGWDGAQEYPTLGRWAGDRIIVIGDYDQEYEWIFEKMDEGEFKNIIVEICRDLAKWCKENGLEELAAMYERELRNEAILRAESEAEKRGLRDEEKIRALAEEFFRKLINGEAV